MAFQVVLYPSDVTPPPGAFQAAVHGLIARQNAAWVDGPDDGDLRLANGAEIVLFMDEVENVAAFALDRQDEAAFDLIHAVAAETGSVVTLGSRACALPSAGHVASEFADGFDPPTVVLDREDVGDWLRVVMREERPKVVDAPARRPQPSFFGRLSDALFGKSI